VGALLLALGLVSGIVGLAVNQADDPTIRRFLQRRRLDAISRKPDRFVTLPEAEDGIVLSRRFGEKFLLSRFTKLVASIKKYTPTRRHP
jgi:hypothetical protein